AAGDSIANYYKARTGFNCDISFEDSISSTGLQDGHVSENSGGEGHGQARHPKDDGHNNVGW
ncbi:hypothetical protein CSHISOI_07299, partial [Colletotrichum shisoi]